MALLQSYEAKKKYGVASHPVIDIKAKLFSSGTMFQLSRRCFPSSIRVPKIVSPKTANVYDDTRSPHNTGGTFGSGYSGPTTTWRKSDGYFKTRSRRPVKAGQLSPRPHLDRKVQSRQKGLRRPSLHSESSRRESRVLLNNRSVGNNPLNWPAHCGRDILSFRGKSEEPSTPECPGHKHTESDTREINTWSGRGS